MKVENMLKLKEEFDYKSLSRRLDIQLDKLIAEHERQQKAFEDEIERIATEAQNQISEVEKNYADALEASFYFYIWKISWHSHGYTVKNVLLLIQHFSVVHYFQMKIRPHLSF